MDPAVGTGNFLIEYVKMELENLKNKNQNMREENISSKLRQIIPHLYGIDINMDVLSITLLRFIRLWKQYTPKLYTKWLSCPDPKEKTKSNEKKDPNKKTKFTDSEKKNPNPIIELPNLIHENFLTSPLFKLDQGKGKAIFNIIFGNPPYGNLLDTKQKQKVERYCSYTREISAVFIERSIPLIKKGGGLYLITSYAITFHLSLSRTRNKLYSSFRITKISSFDRNNCKLFKKMTQSLSIVEAFWKYNHLTKGNRKHKGEGKDKGKMGEGEKNHHLQTTRMYREMPGLSKMEYSNAEAFLLGKGSLGVPFGQKHRLPKIGDTMHFLKILKTYPQTIESLLKTKENGGKKIWYRSSGNYWYNAWDRQPYESSEMKYLMVQVEMYDFLLCVINSQLFYLWVRIYGDGRHLNKNILLPFPIPKREQIKKYQKELGKMRKNLMEALFSVFDEERHRFHTSKIKEVLDRNDLLLSKVYGYGQKHLRYISPNLGKNQEDSNDNKNGEAKKLMEYLLNFERSIHGGKKIKL